MFNISCNHLMFISHTPPNREFSGKRKLCLAHRSPPHTASLLTLLSVLCWATLALFISPNITDRTHTHNLEMCVIYVSRGYWTENEDFFVKCWPQYLSQF